MITLTSIALAFVSGTIVGALVVLVAVDRMVRREKYQPQRDIDWIGLSPMTARRNRHGYQPSSPASKTPPTDTPDQGTAGKQ